MAPEARIRIESGTFAAVIGALVRDVRVTIGWSQEELADRARTSQSRVSRIESAKPGAFGVDVVERLLVALGLRATLEVEGRHLGERREQRDAVHAAMLNALAGRLRRAGWSVATEVPTGGDAPTGWIDLAAYRRADGAMLLAEIKADLPDVGGMQRQVAWYEASAARIAARLGWRPRRIVVAVVCLDSAAIADTLVAHRELLRPAFPGDPRVLARWVDRPRAPPPDGRTLVVTDLAPRRTPGLLPSRLASRTREPAYAGYREAADVLRLRRRRGVLPRTRPSSSRSPPP